MVIELVPTLLIYVSRDGIEASTIGGTQFKLLIFAAWSPRTNKDEDPRHIVGYYCGPASRRKYIVFQ